MSQIIFTSEYFDFFSQCTRVRDHCHLIKRYRGPAYSNCNLNYKDLHCIPVVFHNLFGYNAHFIKEIAMKDK